MSRSVSPFANRSLASWVEDLQRSESAEDRYRALLAVNALGTSRDVVYWCGRSLNDTDSSVRALAAKQLGERKRSSPDTEANDVSWGDLATALESRLRDPDPDVCFEAARALGTLDPQVAEARRVLLTMLDDEGTQPLMVAVVVSALGQRGDVNAEELVPRLRKLITHPQAEVRENATAVVAKLGSGAADLIAELIVAVDDDEPIVRENAAIALGRAGMASSEVVAALQQATHDEDEGVARSAKEAIAMLSQ